MKGYRTSDIVGVEDVVSALPMHSFYPCLFYPEKGWFFLSPIPLPNPIVDAAAILEAGAFVSFDNVKFSSGANYTEEFWLEIKEELQKDSILSVYTPLYDDALAEIKIVNGLLGFSGDSKHENHADKGGIQFEHFHPMNHEKGAPGTHMCYDLPVIL